MWAEAREIDGPEVGGGWTCSGEDGCAIESDVDSVWVEGGGATVVA